jgi:arylformamidase
MHTLDYEAEYNNRARVPQYVEINAGWFADAARYRAECTSAALDCAYGPGERHRYDYFPAAGMAPPLVFYIHGGYWQRGDRKDFSFLARALNAGGISVALPSYPLCPAVRVMDIVADLRTCLAAVWARTRQYPLVVGHSAGGHLAAAMLATDWSGVAGVPPDLVRAAMPVSGVFDLAPLIGTSLNEALRLDAAEARAASPLFWAPPPAGRRAIVAVGGAESGEFLRQARELAEAWRKAGVDAEELVVPAANHFTVVDELARPDAVLFRSAVSLARACAER